MKLAVLACIAALTLRSGCMIFEDGFIEDEDDGYLTSPIGH